MSSRLWGSLRLRLLVAVGLLVAVAIVGTGLISSGIANHEVRRFLSAEDGRRAEAAAARLRQPLEAFFGEHGSWRGVEGVLDDLAPLAGEGAALLVLDEQLRFVASSQARLQGVTADLREDGLLRLTRPMSPGGSPAPGMLELLVATGMVELSDSRSEKVGTLVVLPGFAEAAPVGPAVPGLAISRRVMEAVAVAGVLALAATWWLTRRVLAPVSELTEAVREMAAGCLDRRVAVRSSDEIGALSAAFNAMADSLQRLEGLRRNMVSDVAHELRTPLTGIRCQLEALQDGLVAPGAAAFDSLHDDVLALQRLVDELQELAVAEAGGLRLGFEPVRLEAEVEAVLRALGNGGPEVVADVDGLPPVRADRQRLRQVLRNLLANACQYAAPWGVVSVSAALRGGMVEVAVCDDGPGIVAEQQELVFERFWRADPSRGRGTGGAGLGLAITRQLVQAHGGRIWVVSEGTGACFVFTLPPWKDSTIRG